MLKRNIKVNKTARYFILGSGSKRIKQVWLIFHGYGQLANNFLKQFEPINDGNTLIIAPEGLHRFYWKGFSDKVVASWMTKEDRQDDIEDYQNYLNELWTELQSTYNIEGLPLTLFAYSQGAATLCRWFLQTTIRPSKLIFWAGTLAHDIDYNELEKRIQGTKTIQLFGKNDEFYTLEQLEKIKAFIKTKKLSIEFKLFEGKHELKPELLVNIHGS